jgi:hypothetical protein
LVEKGIVSSLYQIEESPYLKANHISSLLEVFAGWEPLGIKYLDSPDYDFYNPSRRLEVLQFLRDDIDFSDSSAKVANGWELATGLIVYVGQTDRAMEDDPVQWILLTFKDDLASTLQEQPVSMNFVQLWLSYAITCGRLDVVEIIADSIGKQHPSIWTNSAALHYAIVTPKIGNGAFMNLEKARKAFQLFMAHGADPHFCKFNMESRRYESPTSLSMYNSSSFWWWRTMIHSLDYEVEKFIADELSSRSMLRDEGWESDILLALFMHDFVPIFRARGVVCRDCGETLYHPRESWWMATLRKVRERQPLDLTSAISNIQWEHAITFDSEVYNAYEKGWVYLRRPSAFDPNLYTDDTRPLGDFLRGCEEVERNLNREDAVFYQDEPDDNGDEQDCDGNESRSGETHSAKFKQNGRKGIFAHCYIEPPPSVGDRYFDFKHGNFQWAYRSAEEITCPDCWAYLEEELALAREAGTLGMPGAFVPG